MKQKTSNDCGVVALAKAMNESYEFVFNFADKSDSIGLSSIEMMNILSLNHYYFGYACTDLFYEQMGCTNQNLRCHLDQEGIKLFIGDNRSVVIERKDSGAIHALYFDGDCYFDPTVGEFLDNYNPTIMEAIIIKDD